ncbi:PqqD family protein [Oryzobacter telluris]|uniref:PqqD family protein n=1 Tax=Oryzobacter telluris TaxID=3149179 RepID=UPI00370D0FCD
MTTTDEHRVVVAHDAGWVELDGTVYPARLPDGPPLVLADVGALVWHAVVAGGTLAQVVDRVADQVGQPVDEVAAGVTQFVDGLVEAGVLERRPA